jgi:hypothetical protein
MKVNNEYQMFFKQPCFTHHITLPPSSLNEKSVISVMRKIEFKLNKTFLKSSFPKYKETDRFRFFIFPEDKNLHLQHFHILLYSPTQRTKEFNADKCIACKFREEPYFFTCPHCTARVLHQLVKEELPRLKDVCITISSETDDYTNIYATKKQNFQYEYADSYLVC